MAEPAAGGGVSVRVSGRHPLQGEGKSPVSDKGGICGFGHHHGRHKGYPGRLDWGAREQQILAECAE